MTQPVFRFAPSPNGWLHLGHGFSALITDKMARSVGGRFLLRIEDIDLGRTREEFVDGIYEDLRWLGLEWEEPVIRQSERFDLYKAAAERLKQNGLLFPCFCNRQAIAETSRESDPDGAPVYAGTCRDLTWEERDQRILSGEPFAMRLDMTAALDGLPELLSFSEVDEEGAVRDVLIDPARFGDVVIQRKDVPTSYHLAVVLDDAAQGITHVTRGMDLFAATDIHRLLQHLLGLPAPQYSHHRLILDETGQKLSKSLKSTALKSLREAGKTPHDIKAMLGFA